MKFLIKNITDDEDVAEFNTDNVYVFFYKTGKNIADLPANKDVAVLAFDYFKYVTIAEYQLIPSQGNKFIREQYWDGNLLSTLDFNVHCNAYKKMKKRYLTMVNPQWNNYKFYELTIDHGDFVAKYGRISNGTDPQTYSFGTRSHIYELRMYWIKYFEKIAKGYTDQTEIVFPDNKTEQRAKKAIAKSDEIDNNNLNNHSTTKDNPIATELFKDLYSCSAQIVHTALINNTVTYRQIKEAKKIYKTMLKRKTVNGFNRQLTNLLALSPRNIAHVADLMAKSQDDFSDIANREKSLINSMDTTNSELTDFDNSFAGYGVQIYEATDKQAQEVLDHIWRQDLKDKVVKIYRVIDLKKKKQFDEYLKKNQIKNIKEFFHGSTNENWLSIIKYGLELNPNASITGKMFGNGIYFAPDANKSYKYSSCEGSYWANGTSDHGYLGLYATAYGNPNISDGDADYNRDTQEEINYLKKNGYNCLHAKAGNMLQNDEIVFYDEKAMLLNYLIEFSA